MAYLQQFHANGKLLLTGEYAVLDGAQALAVPTKLGQQMEVVYAKDNAQQQLQWNSFDSDQNCWFSGTFDAPSGVFLSSTDQKTSKRLSLLFQEIKKQQPHFFVDLNALTINTYLEFPRDWGLGSSSTLVHLLAQWAKVDPFLLQFAVFGGSGYDIACAGVEDPILYHKINGKPLVQEVEFHPPFLEQLYLVHLGKKQDTRKGIAQYRENAKAQAKLVKEITLLTHAFLATQHLSEFEQLIVQHEALISNAIKLESVKTLRFPDYWGAVKSLGAWGGDFVLVTSKRSKTETKNYFLDKGLEVFLEYKELVK